MDKQMAKCNLNKSTFWLLDQENYHKTEKNSTKYSLIYLYRCIEGKEIFVILYKFDFFLKF